jgi:hypothetical protein
MCFKTANRQRSNRQHLPKSVHNVQHNLWSKDTANYYYRYSLNTSSLLLCIDIYTSSTILFPLSATILHKIMTQIILCRGRTTEPRLWLASQFLVQYQFQILILILSPHMQNTTWLIQVFHSLSDFKNIQFKVRFQESYFRGSNWYQHDSLNFMNW